MPRLSTETTGGGDRSWLGSTHGIAEARTETLNVAAFTAATHYPQGFIPAGTPVAKVAGKLVPYDATETVVTDAGVLAGFVLTDQTVAGATALPVALLDHGRVRTAKLPLAFTAPVAAAKRAATTIVFI